VSVRLACPRVFIEENERREWQPNNRRNDERVTDVLKEKNFERTTEDCRLYKRHCNACENAREHHGECDFSWPWLSDLIEFHPVLAKQWTMPQKTNNK